MISHSSLGGLCGFADHMCGSSSDDEIIRMQEERSDSSQVEPDFLAKSRQSSASQRQDA